MTRGDPVFDIDDAEAAGDDWGFNCGPAALCAVTGKTPAEIRPYMGDFERKHYTNPTLMAEALQSLGVGFTDIYSDLSACSKANDFVEYPDFGLVRIQWAGRWTKPGVPIVVRYRHTHWIAVRATENKVDNVITREVFDVNAMCVGGWIPWSEWVLQLVPWLLPQAEPKASGKWWPTHCWEIKEPSTTKHGG